MAETGDTARTRIGSVLHPVSDLTSAINFYMHALRVETQFVDGERFAQLATDGVALALTGSTERLTSAPAAAIKVPDLDVVLTAFVAGGGAVVRPVQQGPHELRVVARDPWHNTMVIYST